MSEEENPKCPKCKTELGGWTEPSKGEVPTIKDIFTILAILAFILMILISGAAGTVEGTMGRGPTRDCEKWFSKRWHYVLPAYQVACHTTEWLKNVEDREEL